MKLPRDLSARELVTALRRIGYIVVRQTGSHMRLTCETGGEHHVTIPNHDSLRAGTLNAIFSDIAEHRSISREDLLEELFR